MGIREHPPGSSERAGGVLQRAEGGRAGRRGGDVAGVGAAGVQGEGGKRWVTPRLDLVSGLTQQESDYKFREAFPSRFLFLFSFFLFFSIHRFYFLEPS